MAGKNEREKANLSPENSIDVLVPTSMLNNTSTGESSVLIQIDPRDARNLDFEGAAGAIGRFEAGGETSKFLLK
jgi:hypothetical protein